MVGQVWGGRKGEVKRSGRQGQDLQEGKGRQRVDIVAVVISNDHCNIAMVVALPLPCTYSLILVLQVSIIGVPTLAYAHSTLVC